jgi:hypothetical protein
MARSSTRPPRADGHRARVPEPRRRAGARDTQSNTSLPCPDCGMLHDYDCRRYIFINIVAALWIVASLPILIAALPGAVR